MNCVTANKRVGAVKARFFSFGHWGGL